MKNPAVQPHSAGPAVVVTVFQPHPQCVNTYLVLLVAHSHQQNLSQEPVCWHQEIIRNGSILGVREEAAGREQQITWDGGMSTAPLPAVG